MTTKTLPVLPLRLLLLVLLYCNQGFSQSLVNSTGNTLEGNTIIVEYAIGEICINTLSNGDKQATQGLLQPVLSFRNCNVIELLPNAFTPNKDNLNDCFGVKNWPAGTSFELSVYNRWGVLVFKTNNISECWNGEFKGQLQPVGTYVYSIKASTASCGSITNKGTVTLIR